MSILNLSKQENTMSQMNSLLLAIKDAYRAGDSVLWIAHDLGVSVDMVARAIDQYGSEWGPRGIAQPGAAQKE